MRSQRVSFSKASSKNYRFRWSKKSNSYLTRLRQTYKLRGLTKNCKDDYEIARALCHWVHTRWKHSGANVPKKADPISILEASNRGERFRCVEYSIVLSACLNALGIKARILGLMVKEVETRKFGAGHVVVEAYIKQYKKWVFLDPQFDITCKLDEVPLNAVELRHALEVRNYKPIKFLSHSRMNSNKYAGFVIPYLFYFRIGFDNRIGRISDKSIGSLILVPLGHKQPRIFERQHRMKNVVYTHSMEPFYRSPNS